MRITLDSQFYLINLLLYLLLKVLADVAVRGLVEAVDAGGQGALGPHQPRNLTTDVGGRVLQMINNQ